MLPILIKGYTEIIMKIESPLYSMLWGLKVKIISKDGQSVLSLASLMDMGDHCVLIFWETTCTISSSMMRTSLKVLKLQLLTAFKKLRSIFSSKLNQILMGMVKMSRIIKAFKLIRVDPVL